ncbi:MAG: CHAT domain-containing protein [Nakamurella multipartita]
MPQWPAWAARPRNSGTGCSPSPDPRCRTGSRRPRWSPRCTRLPVGRARELLVGEAATGRAVLDAIPHGGLVHIAAHGHHEPDNPLFSGVLLADGLLYGYDVAPNPALPVPGGALQHRDVGRTDDQPGGEPLGLVAALLRSGVSTVVAGTSRISTGSPPP